MEPSKVLEACVASVHRRPIIRLGSSGPLVREWQVLMQREMRAPIRPTGIFDAPTHAATMQFQRKAKLPPDGVVGAKTWAAAAVAPCYALALSKQQAGAAKDAAQAAAKAHRMHWWQATRQREMMQRELPAVHGIGAFSFSVLDTKSMVLGGVLGLGLGAVIFGRK